MESNSASSVAALVNQLKSGEISKQQLFDQLSQLHKRSASESQAEHTSSCSVAPSPAKEISPSPLGTRDVNSGERDMSHKDNAGISLSEAVRAMSRPAGTDEERRAIIQKLIEEKRKKQQPTGPAANNTDGKRLDDLLNGGSDALQQSYQRYRGLVNRNEAYMAASHSRTSSPVREGSAIVPPPPPALSEKRVGGGLGDAGSHTVAIEGGRVEVKSLSPHRNELLAPVSLSPARPAVGGGDDGFVHELNESIAQILHKHTMPAHETHQNHTSSAAAAPSPHKWAHETTTTRLRNATPVHKRRPASRPPTGRPPSSRPASARRHSSEGRHVRRNSGEFVPTKPKEFELATSRRFGDSRAEKAQVAAFEEEFASCTFRPQINEPSVRSKPVSKKSASDFYSRTTKWKEDKVKRAESSKEEKDKEEIMSCTFAPSTNRGLSTPGPSPRASQPATGEHVTDRLYSLSKNKRDYNALKEQLEQEEIQRTCTFQPEINKSAMTDRAAARYLQSPSKHKSDRHRHTPSGLDECTFNPQTNKVPRHMSSAQSYLEADPFERLYGASTASSNRSMARSQPGTPAKSQWSTSSTQPNTPAAMDSFLERQQRKEEERQQKLSKLKQSQEPSHEPMLCKKSLEISSRRNTSSFLQRQKEHDERKIDRNKMLQRKTRDRECTFKPRISQKGMEQRARSVEELSTGDALKKEALQEALRLRAQQQEMRGATFQPRILQAPGVEGRLKILSEPETYIARVQQEQMANDRKMIQHQIDQQDAELSECTFQPAIHEAPSYVQRIARSMALTRSENTALPVQGPERGWR